MRGDKGRTNSVSTRRHHLHDALDGSALLVLCGQREDVQLSSRLLLPCTCKRCLAMLMSNTNFVALTSDGMVSDLAFYRGSGRGCRRTAGWRSSHRQYHSNLEVIHIHDVVIVSSMQMHDGVNVLLSALHAVPL